MKVIHLLDAASSGRFVVGKHRADDVGDLVANFDLCRFYNHLTKEAFTGRIYEYAFINGRRVEVRVIRETPAGERERVEARA